jgi:hypothetical protein
VAEPPPWPPWGWPATTILAKELVWGGSTTLWQKKKHLYLYIFDGFWSLGVAKPPPWPKGQNPSFFIFYFFCAMGWPNHPIGGGSATPDRPLGQNRGGQPPPWWPRGPFFFFFFFIQCHVSTLVVYMRQTLNIWTKNVTEVPNRFLPLTQVPLMK